MSAISIISFDIFQTLVDVDERIPHIWKNILGDTYTYEKAALGGACISQTLPAAMKAAANSPQFIPMREVFITSAEESIKLSKMDLSANVIADNLMRQHAYAPFYSDAEVVLAFLKKHYTVILCSDSSPIMVEHLLSKIPYDMLFLSENIRTYKGDPSGRFFSYVLSELNVQPHNILHIGDSTADIIGAKAAGVNTCWLNRNKKTWREHVQPDFEINTLDKVYAILGQIK